MLDKSEVFLITIYLVIRGALAGGMGWLLMIIIGALISELGGEESDPAMTAILAAVATALAGGFSVLVAGISASILDYLKDRLGTRDKAEEKREPSHFGGNGDDPPAIG